MRHRWAWLGLLIAAFPVPAARAEPFAPDVEEVRTCVERNVPASGRQQVILERIDRAGNRRRLEAVAYWKRDAEDRHRFLVRIQAPRAEQGSAFLLVEGARGSDVWTYLPSLRTVRRIAGRAISGSFFASDFTYEDIAEIQGVAREAHVTRLPDAELDGRAVHVLEGVPTAGSGSSHRRMLSFVDRETCVALRMDLYGPSDQLAKQMLVAWPDVEQQGPRWRARRVSMRDLAQGSSSQLVFGEGEWDGEIPDRLFDPRELPRSP